MPYSLDESTLNQAIKKKDIALFYQPQIDLASGQVVGFSGLLKFLHPGYRATFPQKNIPVAEQSAKIEQLNSLVIDSGFKFMEKLHPGLSLSLNIPAESIKDNHLIDTLDNSCNAFDIDPHRVVLELTQSSALKDVDQCENILNHLTANGFRLGVDDSEIVSSSISQSLEVPFSELKIDKSLVETMVASSQSRKSIIATIELAKRFGLSTIAGGIENNLVAIGLRELGCQLGQGYFFAKPMMKDQALAWLESWNNNFNNQI